MKKITKLITLALLLSVTFSSCTKKSNCADAVSPYGNYHTGYFTYFDEKITLDPDGFDAHDVNAIFIYDNYYPTCTIGVIKKTIPLNFRNNGEEVHVAVSGKTKQMSDVAFPESPFYLYLDCIEKID